jgi:hypothetical protein
MYRSTCVYVCVCVYMYIYAYIRIGCENKCRCSRKNEYIYIYIHTYIYIYTHTHMDILICAQEARISADVAEKMKTKVSEGVAKAESDGKIKELIDAAIKAKVLQVYV